MGRRPGLLLGHVLIGLGAVTAALVTAAGSLVGLLGSAVLFGAGAGIALLGRGALADRYPPKRRGRAVGVMLAASTVGAGGAAPLVAAVQAFAESNSPFRAAIVSAVIGQAAMVSVMGVAPIVVHDHGHGDVAVSGVLSAHVLGMFALMPGPGGGTRPMGRKRGLVAAAIVSAVGAPAGALGSAPVVTSLGLLLVGLGWSGAYLGSTRGGDVTGRSERASALGLLDLIVSAASAVGALMGGVLLEAGGFSTLTLVVAVSFLPALALAVPLREPEPGRWSIPAAVPA